MRTKRKVSWAVSVLLSALIVYVAVGAAREQQKERDREYDCRSFVDESVKNGLISPSDEADAYKACLATMPSVPRR